MAEKARQQREEDEKQQLLRELAQEQKAIRDASKKSAREAEKKSVKRKEVKARQAKDISRFIGGLQGRLRGTWTRPISMASNLSCKVRVRLRRNGQVKSAKIARSSGNSFFDQSALNAVYKASPLPIPNDSDLYTEHFKSFTFTFKPE